MLAVAKTHRAPGAEIVERPVPEPGRGEALVRLTAASICGTDKHIYKWNQWAASRLEVPVVFGHECAGEVVAVGEGSDEVAPGDYVSVECHVFCDRCHQCATGRRNICANLKIFGVDFDGCFAEYFTVPARNLWKNDPALAPEIACLQDPFGNATYCVSSCEVSGKTVAIMGDGPIGIFAAGVARAFGAARIFGAGMVDWKLDLMKKLGADEVVNVRRKDPVHAILSATGGVGVDVALEMTGVQPAIDWTVACLRKGGTMAAFGLPSGPVGLDFAEGVIFKGLTILGINGREVFRTWEEMGALLGKRVDVRPVLTHTFKLADFVEAMETALDPNIDCGKVVLTP